MTQPITTITDESITARLENLPTSPVGVRSYHAANHDPLHFLAVKRNGSLSEIADPGIRMVGGMEVEVDTQRVKRSRLPRFSETRRFDRMYKEYAEFLARYVRDIMGGKGLRDVEHDGSVKGFEIITEPATLAAACYGLPWDELCKFLDYAGCRAHDGEQTGIHVHISRASLGMDENARDMCIAKILVLMDRFENQLTKFARREWATEYYCQKNSFIARGEKSSKKMVKKFKDTEKNVRNRYRALNLTNANTIEFRIFKSTLSPLSIRAIYQLCFTLAEYAKTHTTPEIQEATWSDLVDTCKLPELKEYCTQRGIA